MDGFIFFILGSFLSPLSGQTGGSRLGFGLPGGVDLSLEALWLYSAGDFAGGLHADGLLFAPLGPKDPSEQPRREWFSGERSSWFF